MLSLVAANLKSLLQITCLTSGVFSFYGEWMVRVFFIPILMVAVAALRLVYVRHSSPEAADDAASTFRSNLFVVVFLVYPGVCNESFSIFACRTLDGDVSLLRSDYRVSCTDSEHSVFTTVAAVVIAVFAIGAPFAMIARMVRRMSESDNESARFVSRRVADELKIDDKVATDAIRDVQTGREASFLVNAYKSRYFYWEGVDMVRKLLLVGMLLVVGRGTAAQLFLGILISCTSLVAQFQLQPYKHREDNIFKILVEVHIFLVMVVSLVLKYLVAEGAHDQEVLSAWFYDCILLGSFIAAITVGFVWTVVAKRSMMREALADRALGKDDESSTKAKQRAIKLLHLGLTTNDDMRLLATYFSQLENSAY